MKKIIIGFIAVIMTQAVFAGGWTLTSEINHIEIIRGQGFQLQGDFGNPASCTGSNYIYIPIAHPQYDQLYSSAMIAFTSNKKVRAYLHTCTAYGWHGGTFGTLNGAGSLYIYK